MKKIKKLKDSDNIWDVFPAKEVIRWLEYRPFGSQTSDRDWVVYCAQWEGYLETDDERERAKNNTKITT